MSLGWMMYRVIAPCVGSLALAARVFASALERPLWEERLGDARSDGLEQPRRRHSAPGQPNHGDLLPFQIRLHHRLPHWCESRPSAVRYQLPRPS